MGKEKQNKETEQISIEAAFEKLEETVERLENAELSLEDAFTTYKEGMELLKYCNESIDEVEKKVKAINEEGGLSDF